MKIFNGEVLDDPCEKCTFNGKYTPDCHDGCSGKELYFGQQSILNQCVEVDLNNEDLYLQIGRDIDYWIEHDDACTAFAVKAVLKSIKQFLQE